MMLTEKYGDIVGCNEKKKKKPKTSFYLCILGVIQEGVDNCGLSIIVESALAHMAFNTERRETK